MSKYVYALVYKKSRGFLLEDGKLPIYWNRKIAYERLEKFPNCEIEIINLKELIKFANTHPF